MLEAGSVMEELPALCYPRADCCVPCKCSTWSSLNWAVALFAVLAGAEQSQRGLLWVAQQCKSSDKPSSPPPLLQITLILKCSCFCYRCPRSRCRQINLLGLGVCCAVYQRGLAVNVMHLFLLNVSVGFHVLFNVSWWQCLSPCWLKSQMTPSLCHPRGSRVTSPEHYPPFSNLQ